jgi:hypothetical protein
VAVTIVAVTSLAMTLPTLEAGAANPVQIGPGDVALTLALEARVVYGHGAKYTVTLLPAESTSNLEVSIYAEPKDKSEYLVRTTDVDPTTGVLTGKVPDLKRKTKVRVTWAGDASWPDGDEAKDSVDVRVDLHGRMLRFTGKSGKYYLYTPGKNAFFKSWVEPPKAGENIHFKVERFVNHKWRLWAHGNVPIKHGGATIYVLGSTLDVGTRYRVYAKHIGDQDIYLIGNQTEKFHFKVQ